MERVSQYTQYADPMMFVTTVQTNAAQTTRSQTADRSDFGKMVRQKQQQKDSQDTQKTQKNPQDNGKETTSAQKPQEGKVQTEETEISDNQYILAAALLLQPGVQLVQMEAVTEEGAPEEEAAVDVLPEIEAVTTEDLPVLEEEAAPGQMMDAPRAREEVHETYREVEHREVRRDEGPVEEVQEEQGEETEQVEVTDAAQAAQPVFGPVTTAPVKVADNTAPLDTTAPDATEQLAVRIENLLVDQEEGGRVEFTLIPESLGRISVEIVRGQDGALHVQLNASNLRAADFLQKNSGGLQHLLANPNRPTVDVEVRNSQRTEQQYLNPNAEQQQQQQQRQQQQRREQEQRREPDARNFMQQLRLGLVDLDT